MIYCGTGHRPDKLGGYSTKVENRLFDLALAVCLKYKPTKIISGMALGWDKALAQASLRLTIPLLCAIPFKGQECRWQEVQQREYREILEQAKEVVIVSEGTYTANKMSIRNDFMLDNCDEVFALYNGTSGGTANCVRSANSKGKVVHNFWNSWEKFKGV